MARKKRQAFSFSSAKDELQSLEPVSVAELAKELKTTVDRVLLLLSEGYLTLLKEGSTPFLCVVGKPRPEAMTWLRQALGPLPLVPIIPTSYAMEMLGIKKYAFRALVLDHSITLYIDPAFGEMMTVLAFHELFNQLYPWQERSRFDRQMFFTILAGIDHGDGTKFIRPMSYDEKLEEEIDRISKLPMPQKVIRAMDVYNAYRSAKSIAGVLKQITKPERAQRIDHIMAVWKRKLDRHHSVSSPSSTLPSSSRSSSAISVATSSAGRSTTKPS